MRFDFKTFRNGVGFVLTVEMLDDSHFEVILELAAIGIFEVYAISIVYDPNRELQTIICSEYATFVAIFLNSRREERSLPMLNNQDILNCEC